jgi:hypothetical protein
MVLCLGALIESTPGRKRGSIIGVMALSGFVILYIRIEWVFSAAAGAENLSAAPARPRN